jgi:hypothetical protein
VIRLTITGASGHHVRSAIDFRRIKSGSSGCSSIHLDCSNYIVDADFSSDDNNGAGYRVCAFFGFADADVLNVPGKTGTGLI